MPIFNVQVIQRVTKRTSPPEAPDERITVDRVIVSETNVVALDITSAALIAGRKVPADYDTELLGVAMVRVQKVAD